MKSQNTPKAVIPRLLLYYILGLSLRLFLKDTNIWLSYCTLGFVFVTFFIIRFLPSLSKGIWISILFFLFGLQRISHTKNTLPPIPENGYVIQIIEPPVSKQNSYKSVAKVLLERVDSSHWKNVDYPVLIYFTKKDTLVPKLGSTYLIHKAPSRVDKPKNPNQFNYQSYLAQKGIYYQQFLQIGQVLPISLDSPFNLKLFFKNYALRIGQIIQDNLEEEASSAIVQAMITGVRDDIDRELAQVYTNTGAVHVLSVSGMHVGVIYILCTYILSILFSFFSYKWRKVKIVIILVILVFYACFTGLSPSVVRATTMFIIVQCASFFRRSSSSSASLFLTALLLLVISPDWLQDLGFQLSFLAVYGIIRINPLWTNLWNPQNPIIKAVWSITAVGFSAQLITFPISIFYFHQFPTYFFLANPIVSVLATVLILLALALLFFASLPFTWITSFLGFVLNKLVIFLNETNRFIANLPWAVSNNHLIDFFECGLLYFCILLWIQFFYKPSFALFRNGVLLLCFFCTYNIYDDMQKAKQDMIRVHHIPKSAGLSIIQGKYAVFVSNKRVVDNPLTYEYTLKNYFIAQGIRDFEMVAIPDSINTRISIGLGKKLVQVNWLANPRYVSMMDSANVWLISNQRKSFNYPLNGMFVMDESNKRYFMKVMEAEAIANRIQLINLYKDGAVNIN
ncbi:MAG: ComEC/Rec2 family competence protein [Spirosomataceae bacterium]